jgi:hypothetical protein
MDERVVINIKRGWSEITATSSFVTFEGDKNTRAVWDITITETEDFGGEYRYTSSLSFRMATKIESPAVISPLLKIDLANGIIGYVRELTELAVEPYKPEYEDLIEKIIHQYETRI